MENANIASVRVDMDEEIYQMFKAILALEGRTVRDVISEFIENYVKENPINTGK